MCQWLLKARLSSLAQDVNASEVTKGPESVLGEQHCASALFLHYPLETWCRSLAETG